MSQEMDQKIFSEVTRLSKEGDALAERGDYAAALPIYAKAWEVIPEPKNQWNASTWLLAAMGDAFYHAGYNTSAFKALEYAMTCPEAHGNPFLHLRFGQVLLDRGEEDAAAQQLIMAYMLEGAEIFADEDSRYLAFLKTRAKID